MISRIVWRALRKARMMGALTSIRSGCPKEIGTSHPTSLRILTMAPENGRTLILRTHCGRVSVTMAVLSFH